jgi:nitroreductase
MFEDQCLDGATDDEIQREGEVMSDMIELLRKRRSIRKFTEEQVDPETVKLLVEALLRAPSSRGNDPWEFIVVDAKELLSGLSRAKEHGSEFLKEAPLAIVVCADSTRSDVWIENRSAGGTVIGTGELLGADTEPKSWRQPFGGGIYPGTPRPAGTYQGRNDYRYRPPWRGKSGHPSRKSALRKGEA